MTLILRIKPEDNLLDYWIALEALFLPEGLDREMRQSISLAAANYLGKNSRERRTIYDDLGFSYQFRSYLIHGKRSDIPKKHSLDETVTKTGGYLRQALRRRIEE